MCDPATSASTSHTTVPGTSHVNATAESAGDRRRIAGPTHNAATLQIQNTSQYLPETTCATSCTKLAVMPTTEKPKSSRVSLSTRVATLNALSRRRDGFYKKL